MRFMSFIFIILLLGFAVIAHANSGGLNKQGCHAGSQPYHCHKAQIAAPKNIRTLIGKVTHVRDGDTIEVNGIAVRLSALDCPEIGTNNGDYATKIAKQFTGSQAMCELTGAKTYDRLVGYCSINGTDFGKYMMENSSCKVWARYDVWDRY
jgi:endonuclease YncB( thermonuclease family)|tara:strand:- start:37634 stop:38086 length:453 start_codon:yes stop_codon:yes gene_type:complete